MSRCPLSPRQLVVVMTILLVVLGTPKLEVAAFLPQLHQQAYTNKAHPNTCLREMKRPILDQVASTLFRLENARVEASSVLDEKGRKGEPMEWSESSSLANKFSEIVSSNSLGYMFKQWVADIVAGDYDEDIVGQKIDTFVQKNKVAMFSFSTCPFCRRAKDYLEENGIEYQAMEIDELEGNEGNQIRAMLGRKTQRTSVPSIFVAGEFIGGCNDGPGLLPLAESGELEKLLST
jgi:glutaredoxin 3